MSGFRTRDPVVTGPSNSIGGSSACSASSLLSRGRRRVQWGHAARSALLNVLVTCTRRRISPKRKRPRPRLDIDLVQPASAAAGGWKWWRRCCSGRRIQPRAHGGDPACRRTRVMSGVPVPAAWGLLGEVRDTLGFDVLRFGSSRTGPSSRRAAMSACYVPPGQNSGASAREDLSRPLSGQVCLGRLCATWSRMRTVPAASASKVSSPPALTSERRFHAPGVPGGAELERRIIEGRRRVLHLFNILENSEQGFDKHKVFEEERGGVWGGGRNVGVLPFFEKFFLPSPNASLPTLPLTCGTGRVGEDGGGRHLRQRSSFPEAGEPDHAEIM